MHLLVSEQNDQKPAFTPPDVDGVDSDDDDTDDDDGGDDDNNNVDASVDDNVVDTGGDTTDTDATVLGTLLSCPSQ